VTDVDEACLRYPGGVSDIIAYQKLPGQRPLAKIEFGVLGDNVHARPAQPRAALGLKGQRQPVGHVDHALVLDDPSGDIVAQPVVASGEVRTRVMHAIGGRLRDGAAGRKVAVAERAQSLAQAFAVRFGAVEAIYPRLVHRAPPGPLEQTPHRRQAETVNRRSAGSDRSARRGRR
jgi:hypothetical protein